MNIDLGLINEFNDQIDLGFNFEVSDEIIKDAGLLYLRDVYVSGYILRTSYDLKINLNITGNYGIPCAITLNPVDVPFAIEIDKYLEEIQEEIDKNLKINENTLDIFPIIWENVLVEIPMKVTSPNASLDKSWEYVANDNTEENPELAKLRELL